MDYQKIYDNLIKKRLENPPTEKFERHHIVPRSLGGSDDNENIVKLTLREHYIAHLLLCRIHRGTRNYYPMLRALTMMKTRRDGTRIKNSRMFEYFRVDISKMLSEANSGENNGQYGTIWYYNPSLKENKKFKSGDVIPEGYVKGYVLDNIEKAVDDNCLCDVIVCSDCSLKFHAKRRSKVNLCSFGRKLRRSMRDLKTVFANDCRYKSLYDEYTKSGLSIYKFAKTNKLNNSSLYRNWNRLGLIESNYNFV